MRFRLNRIRGKQVPVMYRTGPVPVISEFEQFWSAYPRKVAKTVARRMWTNAMKKVTFEDLSAALEKHKRSRQWQQGVIPNPGTWLNQERWTDELETGVPVTTKAMAGDRASQQVEQAIETRRRRAEMQAQGMTDDAIEAVFEAEYMARRLGEV
jgi:hypothetical protein